MENSNKISNLFMDVKETIVFIENKYKEVDGYKELTNTIKKQYVHIDITEDTLNVIKSGKDSSGLDLFMSVCSDFYVTMGLKGIDVSTLVKRVKQIPQSLYVDNEDLSNDAYASIEDYANPHYLFIYLYNTVVSPVIKEVKNDE